MKSIFSDETFNKKYHLGAVNSINWARILAQITYYFHAYFNLLRRVKSPDVRVEFVVPTGNFGDILAGYFAKQMGLPIARLVVATNENDILDRFFKTGRYEKKPVHGADAEGGEVFDGVKAHEEGAKETLSPAMDILVSSNFERLLWYLARECEAKALPEEQKSAKAGQVVKEWMDGVKIKGGIVVSEAVLKAAQRDFLSCRVSDEEVWISSNFSDGRLSRQLARFIGKASTCWIHILPWASTLRQSSSKGKGAWTSTRYRYPRHIHASFQRL